MDSFQKKITLDSLPLLQWLSLLSVVIFAVWIAWHYGLVQNIASTDITKLSVIIGLIFLGGTVHCAWRAIFLSQQFNALATIMTISRIASSKNLQKLNLPQSPIVSYISHTLHLKQSERSEQSAHLGAKQLRLDEVLAEHLKGAHESGWFVTGLLIKLGLLGTVIGFILMLSSISGVITVDISQIHLFFSEITYGMRVALNTTLVGLIGTMLLGIQYLLLDRHADKMLADAIHFSEMINR